VNEPEATIVRAIFERFVRIGSATVLARELRKEGVRSKRGNPVDKGYLYKDATRNEMREGEHLQYPHEFIQAVRQGYLTLPDR
jgi:site-specific DNA recombinase